MYTSSIYLWVLWQVGWLWDNYTDACIRPQLKKFAQNGYGNFLNFLPIMLFMLPIMFILCSNMSNIDVCKNLLLECSTRLYLWCLILSMHFSVFECSIRTYWIVEHCTIYFICSKCSIKDYRLDYSSLIMLALCWHNIPTYHACYKLCWHIRWRPRHMNFRC